MSLLGLGPQDMSSPKLVLASLVCCGKGNRSLPELVLTRELGELGHDVFSHGIRLLSWKLRRV